MCVQIQANRVWSTKIGAGMSRLGASVRHFLYGYHREAIAKVA